MIYEDLLSFWIAYLLWEFLPPLSDTPISKLSTLQLILLYMVKEIFFITILLFIRKKYTLKSYSSSRFIDKFLLFFIFILFAIDLSLLKFKNWFYSYYYSSILALLWFLHYYLLFRLITLPLSLNYLRFFFGLIIPFLILITLDETLAYFNLSFKGQFLFTLLIILIISPYIIIKIWPVKKLSESPLKAQLDLFLKFCRLSFKEYLIIPSLGGKFYTAGVLGFIPPFRYLFFSSSLLALLNLEQILGVVAHEVGHIKKKHGFLLLLTLISFPLLLLNSTYLFLFIFLHFFSSTEELIDFLKSPDVVYLEIAIGIFLISISILFFRYVFAYFLRNLEREADLYALSLLGKAEPLISALYKIGEATGQLFHKSWHHFGLWERINFLKLAEKKPAIISLHSRKVRLLLLLWILGNSIPLIFFLYSEGVTLREFLQFLLG